ncbi:hypothetical protein OGAPHI_002378 [Ogataea philodendri]|uniref:Alpha-1,3-mannosyltransferase n=1 Tax=Ogataea philodendri TaxID=1378263 RepID=A0A9P8PCA3_9ASCO|nr:uncharacterized protein OGAPHI_002378 [Ogataea philodendri]KAH3668624.1 hypothetical protein OGAPHI_002378 [Ogataea philodendri]
MAKYLNLRKKYVGVSVCFVIGFLILFSSSSHEASSSHILVRGEPSVGSAQLAELEKPLVGNTQWSGSDQQPVREIEQVSSSVAGPRVVTTLITSTKTTVTRLGPTLVREAPVLATNSLALPRPSAPFKPMANLVGQNVVTHAKSSFYVDPQEYPVYARLIQSYGDDFLKESLADRCVKYFEHLYLMDPDWKIGPHKVKYDDAQLNTMVQNTKHLGIYTHCFLSNTNEETVEAYKKLIGQYPDIESRVFPYISRKLPVFVRWTGEQITGPPTMAMYLKGASQDPALAQISKSKLNVTEPEDNDEISHEFPYFLHYKTLVNGKGVVISGSDKFLDDNLALIRNLRALGNRLPIQIVHRGDLSIESQWKIIEQARKDSVYYPRKEYNQLKQLGLDEFDPSFPRQEVWFVNISRAMNPQYALEFPLFYNKLLAYLFNSFQDIVLLDSDVVLFRRPEQFFQLSQYQSSQSVFFRDRNLIMRVNDGFIDFLKRLLPKGLDTKIFDVKRATYKTLGSRYFTLEFGHYMESGVVAIQRPKYWNGMFTTIYLALLKPIHENVWGDKELFWIGQSVAGNEDYMFNDYWSAAIGTLTPAEQRAPFKSQELCSTHPGHISSDDDRLLWINSGILNCRRTETYEKDFDVYNATLGFETKEQLLQHYKSPLNIEHAIIPPDSMHWVESFDTPREPRQGYIKQYNCAAYLWCAYDKIGGSEFPEHQGRIFKFETADTVLFDYIGRVYLGEPQETAF